MSSLKKYYFACSKCKFDQFGYDPDFANVLKRACQLKYTLPTLSERTKINQLFLDLKSTGVWAKQDQILNFAYNNLALANFSMINWKKPLADVAIAVTGITYTINGFKGDALTGCINTSFKPSSGIYYTPTNAGRLAVLYYNPVGNVNNSIIDGASTGGSGGEGMFSFSTNAQRISTIGQPNTPNISMDGIGTRSINRDDATNTRVIKNATQTALTQANDTLLSGLSYSILRRGTNYGLGGVCFHQIGGSLTLSEVQNFRTAYNAYMTSMGLTPIA